MKFEKCDYETCPIIKVLREVGLDAFIDGVKEERAKAMGLLNDWASLIIFVDNHSSGGKTK